MGSQRLTGMIAVADTMTSHTCLTSPLLSINQHHEGAEWHSPHARLNEHDEPGRVPR